MPRRGRAPSLARSRSKAKVSTVSGVRLQRVLAAAGVAARRACEAMITQGRVEVNGAVVRTLPVFVDPAKDKITVDGRPLPRARSHAAKKGEQTVLPGIRLIYLMVYKPPRVLCTTKDDTGRRTVMEFVDHPALGEGVIGAARVFPVGRLDFHTEGLVLLTNDGALANRLTHARYGVTKTYQAAVKAALDEAYVADLEKGLNLKHQRALQESGKRIPRNRPSDHQSIRVKLSRREGPHTLLNITLTETGERSIGDMLGEAGLKLAKLTRIALGPVILHGVAVGQWRELERGEIRALRKAAGMMGDGEDRPNQHAQSSRPARGPKADRGIPEEPSEPASD